MIKHTIELYLEYNRAIARRVLRQKDFGNFQVKCMYESKDFVGHYISELELQPPEAEILQELRNELPNLKMLDIGVGAGRTTQHFAGLAKEYIGIDYSSTMIEACRKKFPQYRLEVADARNLSIFDDAYFDFILFSFNGIDAVEHEDRPATFAASRPWGSNKMAQLLAGWSHSGCRGMVLPSLRTQGTERGDEPVVQE